MAYVVPQVLVYQEFNLLPTEITDPLRSFIAGPNYKVFKYSDAAKKALIKVGQYNAAQNTEYSWPNRPAGAVVDPTYSRVFIDNALLRYFRSESGDSVQANSTTEIETDGTAFKGGGAYPFTRDVKVGDVVHVAATVSSTLYEKWTYVTAVKPKITAASVGSATADSANQATIGAAAVTIVGTATGGFSTWSTSTDVTNGYAGCAAGYAEETYTIVITEGGAFSNDGDSVSATVTSASGTDNGTFTVTRSGTSNSATIGSRGVTIKIKDGTYAVGDKLVILVKQAYTAPVPTLIANTYTGDINTTYLIEVLNGNDTGGSDTAKIRVRTHNGYDSNSEDIDVVSASFGATSTGRTAITLGTHGLTFYFQVASGTNLIKGSKWSIAATAAADGAYKILTLAHPLPSQLVSGAPVLTLSLYLKKNIEVPKKAADNVTVYWTADSTDVTLSAGIEAYDSEVKEADGDLLAMPVEGTAFGTDVNLVYVQYRALLQTYASEVQTISDIGDVASLLGDITADNPLALGVYFALVNSGGTAVKFMGVPTDDLAGYSAVVDKLYDRNDIYALVPLSKAADVQALFAGHVAASSSAERGRWRITVLNSDAQEEVAKVASPANDEKTATITLDSETNEYTLVTWTSGTFIANGVLAGDVLRINYDVDGTYEEYVVDSVLDETHLRLLAGPATPYAVARKFEVWHSNSKNEVAAAYAAKSGSFGSRRVFHVWPDKIELGAETISGVYLAAAIAGLISGVVPQQGLTNLAISGFTGVTRTTAYFNTTQLNTMAEGGTFIITQDPSTGAIFTRHQLSTDTADLNSSELSVVKNVDSISSLFLRRLAPYIGIANITPQFLAKARVELEAAIGYLKSSGYIARLGGQLIDAEIIELRQHSTLKDRIVATLNLTIPYPANGIEVHLVV